MSLRPKSDFTLTIKRAPKLPVALLYLLLLIAVMVLFFGRTLPALQCPALLERAPEAYTHISNFCIAYLLVSAIGYAWLMQGVALRWALAMAAVVAVINLAYEAWLPLINTRDPVDGLYGLAGSGLAVCVLVLIDRCGLRTAPALRQAG